MKTPTLTKGDRVEMEGQTVTVLREHAHSMKLSKKYQTTGGPIFFHVLNDRWEWYKGPQED